MSHKADYCYSSSVSFSILSYNSSSTSGLWSLFQHARTNHHHQANSSMATNVTSATLRAEAGAGYKCSMYKTCDAIKTPHNCRTPEIQWLSKFPSKEGVLTTLKKNPNRHSEWSGRSICFQCVYIPAVGYFTVYQDSLVYLTYMCTFILFSEAFSILSQQKK